MMRTWLFALTLLASASQSRDSCVIDLLPQDDVDDVVMELAIIDPDRYTRQQPADATQEAHDRAVQQRSEVEFYGGYGILFEADARDEGALCIERSGGTTTPERRCLTLGALRTLIWSQQ